MFFLCLEFLTQNKYADRILTAAAAERTSPALQSGRTSGDYRVNIPEKFRQKIIDMIGAEEYALYEMKLSGPCVHGLRANRLKIEKEKLSDLIKDCCALGEKVPWCDDGYYFDIDPAKMPGRSAYYLAGLYYIQEPSAMYPAANAMIKPGEKVLDLCAAPGGKSLRAASDLAGKGMLVSNDISASRAGTLLYNLELGGVPNAIVTNCTPGELKKRFGEYFDVVLIDAPCSGEGMFRKDEEALKSWEVFRNDKCAAMQDGILEEAAGLVRPGGRIVYSTCTFDVAENEGSVSRFLDSHPGFALRELPKTGGVSDGFATTAHPDLSGTARLWPHRLKGEGQFAAMMVKERGGGEAAGAVRARSPRSFRILGRIPEEYVRFAADNFNYLPYEDCFFYMMGSNLFICPFEPADIDGLKTLRMGVHAGEISYNRFRPAQHFIMSLDRGAFRRKVDLDPDGAEIRGYLRGECVGGYQIGSGEMRDGIMKNYYPKGWRRII